MSNRPQFNSSQLAEINDKVFDWAGKTPVTAWLNTELNDSGASDTLLDVSGAGTFVALSFDIQNLDALNNSFFYVVITVDGVDVLAATATAYVKLFADEHKALSIPFLYPFRESLEIRLARGVGGGDIDCRVRAIYLLD